jgi:RNA polymerase sigma-70 factor (ECF subfamily)
VLRDLQPRGYRVALLDLRDSARAGDVVQEASEALIRRYGDHPVAEWAPLFYAILRNRIRDHGRHLRLERLLGLWRDDSVSADIDLESTEDASIGPEEQVSGRELGARIE